MSDITTWIENRLPEGWFIGTPDVTVDREEITLVGHLPDAPTGDDPDQARIVEDARIARFREETRRQRMQIADEVEARFGRKLSWGASCGETTMLFTTLSIPVMTRLRQPERLVLDTLVAANVARSRSDALAWCVRLVADNEDAWIGRLRQALTAVDEARSTGPSPSRGPRRSRG